LRHCAGDRNCNTRGGDWNRHYRLRRNALCEDRVCRRSSIRATNWARDRPRQPTGNRLDIKRIFLSATALKFDRNHKVGSLWTPSFQRRGKERDPAGAKLMELWSARTGRLMLQQ
jgi:hypothetical protein